MILDVGFYTATNSASRAAYESLIDAILRCQHSGATAERTDPVRLAALLWPALHGQVTLRLDRPHFPRPPLHDVITDTVQRLIGLRPAPIVRRDVLQGDAGVDDEDPDQDHHDQGGDADDRPAEPRS